MAQRYQLNKNKYLLEPELQRLEALMTRFQVKDLRNVTLLRLALATGARAQELLNLRAQDLNSHDRSVFIQGIKGSNDRELPLPIDLFSDLESLSHVASETSTEGRLFPISYNRLRQIWQDYRPTGKKFHSLRHTFAIRLYKKTRDLRLVQVALGHRNITNTIIYADYIYSQEELRKLLL